MRNGDFGLLVILGLGSLLWPWLGWIAVAGYVMGDWRFPWRRYGSVATNVARQFVGLDYRILIHHSLSMVTGNRPRPLPAASVHIVLALLDGELHGYALMRRVQELSDGGVRMGPGTLYGTLNRLLADGLIVETTEQRPHDETERRRYYRLTGEGEGVATAELSRLRTLVTRLGGLGGVAGAPA